MAPENNDISFYIVAHADDWQLFMNPNVFLDITDGKSRVVIILTTAGDAGNGEEFWTAREEGCKSSIRFCIAPHDNVKEVSGTINVKKHPINYWSANNVLCYFFRLPDGNRDGEGFFTNSGQSLTKLKSLKISKIASLDQSTIYHSWTDFYSTLAGIINYESKGSDNNIWINYLNPDTNLGLYEHPDHRATGEAVQAMNTLPRFHHALFSGYAYNKPSSISDTNLFWKVGMLAAYEKAVFDICGYSTIKENVSQYREWCFRGADIVAIIQR